VSHSWPTTRQRPSNISGARRRISSHRPQFRASMFRRFVDASVDSRIRLYPSTEDHFLILESDIEVDFRRDSHGNIIELQVAADGRQVTANRVK
jgi:hypothetical protein